MWELKILFQQNSDWFQSLLIRWSIKKRDIWWSPFCLKNHSLSDQFHFSQLKIRGLFVYRCSLIKQGTDGAKILFLLSLHSFPRYFWAKSSAGLQNFEQSCRFFATFEAIILRNSNFPILFYHIIHFRLISS